MVTASLLVLASYAVVATWRARRRAVRDAAQLIRQLPNREREAVIAGLADKGMRTDLSRLMSSDQPLPDQACVARFYCAPGSRRELRWGVGRPLIALIGCLAIIGVSGAINPTLNMLCAGGALLAALLIGWRLQRLARADRIIEVSPFNLTEISGNGRRRILSWRQPLVLRYRAMYQRLEVGPAGGTDRIYVDTSVLEFRRAVGLIMEYGGFVEQPPTV
jgi:hypothetical protein